MAEGRLTSLSPSSNHTFEDLANQPVNRVLTTVSASLSMLGTLTIVVTFIAWKDVRSASRRILVYISFADFLIAGSNLYGLWLEKYSDEVECKAQSFVTTCACMWSFFWTTFLAVFIYTAVAWKNVNTAKKTLKVFFLFGWGIPIVVTSIALWQQALGNDSDLYSAGWCWISSKVSHKTMWMWITGKAWEIAAYILISVFYGLLKCHIRRQLKCYQQKPPRTQRSIADVLKAERRLTFVPVVFILLRIWGTVRFIIFITTPHASYRKLLDVLLYLQGIGDSGQGFANFILFCLLTEKFQFHLRMMAYNYKLCVGKPAMVVQKNSTASDHKQPPVQKRPVRETTPLIKDI